MLQKLLPNVHPDQLKDLSRGELIEMVAKSSPSTQIASPPSPVTPGIDDRPLPIIPEAANLEQLQPMPEGHTDGTESRSSGLRGITDDVNALSLSIKKSTSYLGISSVTAVLRVILWLDPEAQAYFAKTPDKSLAGSRAPSSPPDDLTLEIATPKAEDKTPSPWDEIPLINAYFNYMHPLAPLIDEQDFRDTYMTQRRSDARWSLLLNTVLALGSMANASHCDEHGHKIYWRRAKEYLTIETLGSAHIETIQALALLSGLYLHYIQQPNLANSLMGATLRLATALGLHRDYSEGVDPQNLDGAGRSIEMRRRVWWSIFILDAWVGYGLGRPSMGRMSHAISAKAPQCTINPNSQILAIVQENIKFCIISTRMEDALAQSPIIPDPERRTLDNAFADWLQGSSVQNNTPKAQPGEAHGISVIKNVMRWRYLLCRILIHRPTLLWASMRKTPFVELPNDKRHAIEVCREITAELINDITLTWRVSRPCSMSGWNGTWLLYQALMVPLLHLFADRSDHAWNERNMQLVETGLGAFIDLRAWSQTATRSFEVVSRIYQASRRHFFSETTQGMESHGTTTPGFTSPLEPVTEQAQFGPRPLDFNMTNSPAEEVYMNNMFDSLNWSTNWVDESFPFTQAAVQWESEPLSTFSDQVSFDPNVSFCYFDSENCPSMAQPNDGNASHPYQYP